MEGHRGLLTRRVEKILPSKQGLSALLQKRKIRLYQGFDPTGSRLHLGHTIGLRKLVEFAELGHEVIFLFGTGTVLVGDPSQRDTARTQITQEEIEVNISHWKAQVEPLVDFEKVSIRKNGDWLTKLTLSDLIRIASNISAVQLFKRDMFQRRIDEGGTVWFHETMYPLLQGYDSVVLDVDLEIGGTDQEFNMLIGRELMKKMKGKEKFVLTVPMILGTDGKQMSKTSGNCIWLDDPADDMYGKLMSIPDSQILPYLENLTAVPLEEIEVIVQKPLESKKRLAYEVTKKFHGQAKAAKAEQEFETVYQRRAVPKNILKFPLSTFSSGATVTDIIIQTRLASSRSAAKRLIKQGGVEVDGVRLTDPLSQPELKPGVVIKAGKRKFIQFTS